MVTIPKQQVSEQFDWGEGEFQQPSAWWEEEEEEKDYPKHISQGSNSKNTAKKHREIEDVLAK